MKEQIMKALNDLPKLYSNENKRPEEIRKIVKLFNPYGMGIWYLTEYNDETKLAFGMCILQESELGYVSIDEIFSAIPEIEQDLYFNKEWTDICSY
jgi:hypothetical protein